MENLDTLLRKQAVALKELAIAPRNEAPALQTSEEMFLVSKMDVRKEYSALYRARLNALRPLVHTAAVKKWGKSGLHYNHSLLSSRPSGEKIEVIIGTVYKEMKCKPSCPTSVESTAGASGQKSKSSPEDALYIEDEKARLKVVFKDPGKKESNEKESEQTEPKEKKPDSPLSVEEFVTGTVLALRGYILAKGSNVLFLPYDTCAVGYPEQKYHFPLSAEAKISSLLTKPRRLVALVSGLEVRSEHGIYYDKLYHFLAGQFGSAETMRLGKQVEQIIIAGNSTSQPKDADKVSRGSFRAEKINKQVYGEVGYSLELLEKVLSKLLSCCKVTLMPGDHDVGSILLPQKPLNKCLFEYVEGNERLELATNPCNFEVDGKVLLGMSGQSIQDIIMYSKLDNPIEIMKKQLEWRHICPTAPDTLRTYPFEKSDPFILEEAPNIYFVGNQEKFDTAVTCQGKTSVRLITIPNFSVTQSLVLMDIDTLEAYPIDLSQRDTTIS